MVTTGKKRHVRTLATALSLATVLGAAVVLCAFASAIPSSGAPVSGSTAHYYVALGDSLATGFEAPAGKGYVDDLLAHYQTVISGLQLVNFGCPGETTTSFIDGPSCQDPGGSQLKAAEAFLSAHRGQIALVTIDIGGNDIDGCGSASPPFTVNLACVSNALSTIRTNLTQILSGLRAAGGSTLPIYAMNYFDPFVITWLQGQAGQAAARASVAVLNQLNGELTSIYTSAGVGVADVASAFKVSDFSNLVPTQWGTIPASVARACTWLNVICRVGGPEGFGVHPNATGYQVVADTFVNVIGSAIAPAGPPVAPATTAPALPTGTAPSSTIPAASPAQAPPAAMQAPPTGAPTTVNGSGSTALAYTGLAIEQLTIAGLALVLLGASLLITSVAARRRH